MICGYKFKDSNGNGVWDDDEDGLSDWEIRMINVNETVVAQTYTDEDGYYEFEINSDFYGKFRIEEVMQAGWEQTLPSLGYYEVDLGPDIIEWSVNGTVYSEYLPYTSTKRLICGGSDSVNVNVYGKHPGEYFLNADASLRLITLDGKYVDEEYDEDHARYVAPPDPVSAEATITVVDDNGAPFDLDFGNRPEGEYPEGKISGHKFKDNNRNSLWDTGEPGLSNWTIKLYSGEEQIDETVTNSSGYYEFTNLEFGDYRVEEVQQTGWTQTAPDTEENPGYFDVTLDEAYRSAGDLDFGNYRPSGGGEDYGSISGHKFNDLNGNGEWDKDGDDPEPALSGWTINLSNGDTDITDEDGYYSFTRLPYGTYTVSEVQQEGWTQTAPESFDFTVDINRNTENHRDLDFGNEEDSEIIIPPTAGPEPTPIVPLEVKVTPTRVPAGDPTIRVTPGADTVQVYALLPDGRRLELKQDKKGFWTVSFMVAFGTDDGPYPIEVYAVDKFGVTRQSTYTITIDNSLPLMEIKKSAQTNGTYMLEIKPLFNAVAIDYSVGPKTVKLSRAQRGWWSAVVPAGDGSIRAIDESGYQVNQSLSLTVIPVEVQTAMSDAWKTVTIVKTAVVNPESAGTETGTINYSLYLWAAAIVALVLVAAIAIPGRVRSKVK